MQPRRACFAFATTIVLVACSKESTSPLPRLVALPADTLIDIGASVSYGVFDDAGQLIHASQLTVSSSNQVVARAPCLPAADVLTACAAATGTTTITFKATDGRTGTATLSVRGPRFILTSDTSYVARHQGSVK